MLMVSHYKSKGDYSCLECGSKISDKNFSISRHVKKHGILFFDYINKNYELIDGTYSTCGFCDRLAIPSYEIDHKNKKFSINYKSGYFCRTQECKNEISLDLLGIEYDAKKFEKIGSKSEYLMKIYKIDISKAKEMKFKEPIVKFRGSLNEYKNKYGEEDGELRYKKRIDGIIKNNPRNKFPCTLENFIKRYGLDIGEKKYRERCERISYTSSKDFLIEKYGEVIGNEKWKNKFKRTKISKVSSRVASILTNLNLNFVCEREFSGKFVDYYLTDFKIVIEFFGDYWHSNPKIYDSHFYNKQLKMSAHEVWEKDNIRLSKIKNSVDSIIIIWESTDINDSLLEKTINEIKNKKTIIYL